MWGRRREVLVRRERGRKGCEGEVGGQGSATERERKKSAKKKVETLTADENDPCL